MTILVNCGECGKGYRFDDDQAGRMVPCKNCGWDIDIPHRRRPSREGPRPQPRHRSERRPSQAIATQSDEDDEFLDERKSWYQSPVILIGGGIGAAVMLLFVVLIFAVFSRRNKPPVVADNDAFPNQQRIDQFSPPPKQRQPIPERPVAPDRPRFNRPGPPRQGRQPFDQLRPNRVQENPNLAEIVWNVRPDPLPEPITYIQEGISIPVEVRQASLIYPPTPSAFVGIGAIPRDFQIWDLRTIEQTGSIKIEKTVQKQTLSPDGKYLVTERFTRGGSVVMELWSTENATKIRDIPLVTSLREFRLVLFVGPSRLLVCQSNGLFATKVTTIDVETGEIEKQGEMALAFRSLKKSYTISPNGRYMVWHDGKGNTIKAIELSVGSIVGNTRLPSIDQGLNAPDCEALAFSDDGKALAALFRYRSSFRLVSWSVETGQVSNVVDLEGRNPIFSNQLFSTDRPFRLQILSDQVGWLLYGTTLIDRKTGTVSRVLND